MEMAKPYLDFGLQSDRGQDMIDFWGGEVGLELAEKVPVYEDVEQYRFTLSGAVLKLNSMTEAIPPAPRTGYRGVLISRPGQETVKELVDPDGNRILLVPEGDLAAQDLALEVAVSNLGEFQHFYRDILGLEESADNVFIWGNSQIHIFESADAVKTADDHGSGIRYITFQVRDLDATHQALVAAGVTEHMAPTQWNEMSYVSFVRDPDNNLIELSQRKDLV